MGASKSIEQLRESDKKFEEYLSEKHKEIEARRDETRKKMDADIVKFYQDGGWNDRQPLFSSSYIDVQNISEWSLDNVNNILTAIEGAIFGSANPPPGTKIDGDTPNNNVIKQLPSLQLLIMSSAFRAIQGILETFVMKSSTTITMLSKIEVVSPGVTVFVYVNSNSFQQKSFFENSLISQYFYLVDGYTSAKQLGDYSKFRDKQLFELEKEQLRTVAYNILNNMGLADDISKLAVLSTQLDQIYKRLEDVTKRIDNLNTEEHAAILSLAQQVRSRRSLMLAT
jgi:hypothetical protein